MSELILLWRKLTWTQRRAILSAARCIAGDKRESGRVVVIWSEDTKETT